MSGEACSLAFSSKSSLPQGEDFGKMTRAYHGGRTRRQRGGFADLQTAFDEIPAEMHTEAGVSVLNQHIADLEKFVPTSAPVQSGGRRKTRKGRKGGALSPIEAPTMLLMPEDEPAAFLNPQWYEENMVNPNFVAPPSPYIASLQGGKRTRKGAKKARKASKKGRKASKKARKTSKKGRKASKKGRKASRRH
jgi:hypothetical protein